MKNTLLKILLFNTFILSNISASELLKRQLVRITRGMDKRERLHVQPRMIRRSFATSVNSNAKSCAQKCQDCNFAFSCPTYRRAMQLASKQPRGKIGKDELIQITASGIAAGLLVTPFLMFAYPSYVPERELALILTAPFALASLPFAKRAIDCARYANQPWWIANDVRLAISNSRWSGNDGFTTFIPVGTMLLPVRINIPNEQKRMCAYKEQRQVCLDAQRELDELERKGS